jgi:hypothetical protein
MHYSILNFSPFLLIGLYIPGFAHTVPLIKCGKFFKRVILQIREICQLTGREE